MCTYTNVAVDNLVEGLVSSGVKALRVGFGNNIRSSLLEHTLDHKLSMHPLQSTVLELTKKEEDLSANILDLKTRLKEISRMTLSGDMRLVGREKNMKKGLQKLGYERSVLKSKLYAMQQEMLRDVLADADVVNIGFVIRRQCSFHCQTLTNHDCRYAPPASRLPALR